MKTPFWAPLLATVAGALLLASLLETFCWSEGPKDARYNPDPLIVLPAAVNVKRSVIGGRTQVVYIVGVSYPADSALEWISAELGRNGWQPLKRDLWNPTIPSSHVRGWVQFDDATTAPKTTVNQWMAQWENRQHDVVSYTLEYRYATDSTPDFNTLRVFAIFVPAAQVVDIRKAKSQ